MSFLLVALCSFLGRVEGWVGVVAEGVGGEGRIMRTVNSGVSWDLIGSIPGMGFYSVLNLWDTQKMVLVGTGGKIIRNDATTTSDNVTQVATPWTRPASPFYTQFEDPTEDPPLLLGVTQTQSKFVAVGETGTIFISGDKGYDWEYIPSGFINDFNGVSCTSETCYIGGTAGTVIVIRLDLNNLITKQEIFGNTAVGNVHAILAVSSSRICAVGSGGFAISTSTAGPTWTISNTFTKADLNSLTHTSELTVVAVGSLNVGTKVKAVVLSSLNGGRNWVNIDLGTQQVCCFVVACVILSCVLFLATGGQNLPGFYTVVSLRTRCKLLFETHLRRLLPSICCAIHFFA